MIHRLLQEERPYAIPVGAAYGVLFGVLAGFFGLRYLNHPALPAKILGGVVAMVFILAGIFLNFFVAHFRDAVELGLIAATAAGELGTFSMFSISPGEVIMSMFPNIFALESFLALGLLLALLEEARAAVLEGEGMPPMPALAMRTNPSDDGQRWWGKGP